jgi:hypothetical protein
MFFHKVTLAIMHIEIFCRCTFFVCASLHLEYLALHVPASPPDVRQGYALPEAFIEN